MIQEVYRDGLLLFLATTLYNCVHPAILALFTGHNLNTQQSLSLTSILCRKSKIGRRQEREGHGSYAPHCYTMYLVLFHKGQNSRIFNYSLDSTMYHLVRRGECVYFQSLHQARSVNGRHQYLFNWLASKFRNPEAKI